MGPHGFGLGFGGNDLFAEVEEVEAVEDLMQGNIGGALEDELLASIF
jgi:hypothetical protein